MSVKTGKKLGFFGALTMLIGSVVGVGIFFKSHGILRANDWNGTGTFLAWIIGGILSLAAAVSFSEISNVKTKRISGLPAYAEIFGGKKFGYFTRFNFSVFYYGILVVVLSFFGSEIIIAMISSWIPGSGGADSVPIYGHALVSFGISAFVLAINYLSVHASGRIAQITTILKWVPLVLVAFLGIIFATTNNNPTNPVPATRSIFGQNSFANGRPFTLTGLLAALPAVLFAYDAFLGTLSLKDKIKGGEKTLPLVVVVGLGSVIILYTLIALSAVLHGSGVVSGAILGANVSSGLGIFDQVFTGKTAEVFGKLVIAFLAISTFGVINGISAAGVANVEQAAETNTIFGAKTLKRKFGETKGVYILHGLIHLFWSLVLYIPAIALDTDAIVDGISNFPTLFFFAIYAIIILLYTLKRPKLNSSKINNKLFLTFAWIAIIGILWVVGLQIYYTFFMEAILNPDTKTSWGLYVAPTKITQIQSLYITFSFLAIFIGLPFINKFLTKRFENNEVIIDTQA